VRALHEALRVAQQQGDAWALLHSLAALCRVLMLTEGVGGAAAGEGEGEGGGGGGAGGLDLSAVKEQQQALELLRWAGGQR
jgi:hypothetical protein